jgi:uncharacterized protein YukE
LSAVPAEVEAVGEYAAGVADALRSALDAVARDVQYLVGGDWTGIAAEEFGRGWNETRTGGEIIDGLAEMARKLGANADAITQGAPALNPTG